ncbi:MAG: M23 family metallopeptidase [Muribaculaceae bacterium]|nr:M23 family metallopeptidase [Muribaculaceae bacterium]
MKPLYRYNPDTDNFERFYPTLRDRLRSVAIILGISSIIGASLFLIAYFGFSDPTVENLRHENHLLQSQYKVLDSRVESALKVMEQIRNRDDNFYRVILHTDPLGLGQRYAGLDNEARYKEIHKLGDIQLIDLLTRRIDLLDRQLYAQSKSFDRLREIAIQQKERLDFIPAVLPIDESHFNLSSGFGLRRDPISGEAKVHDGHDIEAPHGVEVVATADGTVTVADRVSELGNCIDITHGYNYMTRYAHLSEITVSAGEKVRRGQIIGRIGSTGRSTGPHLHYEVRYKDIPQDPVNYYFMSLNPDQYTLMIQNADNAGHVMD